MGKQYRRCLQLLRGTSLVESDVGFRYLAAKCLAECREWEDCLEMLGGPESDPSETGIELTVSCHLCTCLLPSEFLARKQRTEFDLSPALF